MFSARRCELHQLGGLLVVDIRFVEKFPQIIPLETLKSTRGLESMVVVKKGTRLSVQPVEKNEFDTVVKLARGKTRNSSR